MTISRPFGEIAFQEDVIHSSMLSAPSGTSPPAMDRLSDDEGLFLWRLFAGKKETRIISRARIIGVCYPTVFLEVPPGK